MIDANQIPDEVFEAFKRAWARPETRSTKECLAAALNAWPGMGVRPSNVTTFASCIILPLPQETNDE